MSKELQTTRNIGISAHIDSGKTTTTERILFYTGKIHKIEEVKGGGDGATMDFMELEREKGITITSAATTCMWKDYKINIIDTPGHVDFTIEVERALRVLDGAIMLFCGVAGVQSQSLTVDRQMKRYRVPRIAFINKLDRTGANPDRAVIAMREKLKLNAVPLQLYMGLEDQFEGLIDLITMKAFYFDGDNGENVREEPIPAALAEKAGQARHHMLDALSMFNDQLMELMLEGHEIPTDLIKSTIRASTLKREFIPVMMGSAYKNKGVQLLLDAVCDFLPSPVDCERPLGYDIKTNERIELAPDPDKPLVALAFKLTEEQFGQLTYTRVYQGTLRRGNTIYNAKTGRKFRVGRLVRMHANDRVDEQFAGSGDIVSMVGVDCSSGDTFCDDNFQVSMESMFIPASVVDMSIKADRNEDSDKLSKALNRFRKEDPTFRVHLDPESNETIISGMGELHLEIYSERIRREYKCPVTLGRPKVAYRETITKAVEYDYKHKKQTGGSGQYAHVVGRFEPIPVDEKLDFEFVNKLKGMNIPREFVPAVEDGFRESMQKGPLADYPVLRFRAILEDGSSHDVDSSELAFKVCARAAFREYYKAASPIILEPIMTVECEAPLEYQGTVTGDLSSRRGVLTGTDMQGDLAVIRAEVPLGEMFGYANDIRSKTQGKCTFSMEFCAYRQVPGNVQKEIVAAAEKERIARHKK